MAKTFALTAVLNIAGVNYGNTLDNLKNAFKSVTANVNVKINTTAQARVDKLSASFSTFNNVLARTAITASSAATAIDTLANAVSGVDVRQRQFNTQAQRTVAQVKSVSKVAKDAGTDLERFGHVSGLAVRRFAGFALATGVILGFGDALRNAIGSAVKFQDQMVRLSILAGTSTASAYKDLGDQIQKLSVGLGVSSAKLVEISDTLVQAGIRGTELNDVLSSLAKTMLAPSFGDVNKTVEGTIALMQQFGISGKNVERALGSMSAVAADFAVESSDLITAIKTAGGVFATMNTGIDSSTESLNKFLAIFTSVRATTRESAESVATGLRTIFTRMSRQETIDIFKQLGVELVDLEGKFIGPYNALTKMSEAMRQMDPRDMRFLQIAEALGGYRQINKVLPALMQAETRVKALATAQAGQNSLDEIRNKAQQSWLVQATQVQQKFLALIRDMSKTETFNTMVKTIFALANSFIALADALRPVVPLLGMLMGMKLLSGVGPVLKGFLPGLRGVQGLGRASGGPIPGSGHTDSVPAMLMPGEFVIKQSSAASIGSSELHRMNKTGRVKYANGGEVGGIQHFATGGLAVGTREHISRIAGELAVSKGGGFNSMVQAQSVFSRSLMNAAKEMEATGMAQSELRKRISFMAGEMQKGATATAAFATTMGKEARDIGADRSMGQAKLGAGGGRVGRLVGKFGRGINNVANRVGGVGVAGIMAGGLISSLSGEESVVGGGIGRGISGAAAGASLGSVLGPVGTVAGGIIGGGLGAVSGIRDAQLAREKRVADEALLKATKELDKAFENLSTGGSLEAFQRSLENVASAQELQTNFRRQKDIYSPGNMYGLGPNSNTENTSSSIAMRAMANEGIFGSIRGYFSKSYRDKGLQQAASELAQEKGENARVISEKTMGAALMQIQKTGNAPELDNFQLRKLAQGGASPEQQKKWLIQEEQAALKLEKSQGTTDGNLQYFEAMKRISEDQIRAGKKLYAEQTDAAVKLSKWAMAMGKLQLEFEDFSNTFETVSARLERPLASAGATAAHQALMAGPGAMMGLSESATTNMFANPKGYSPAELSSGAGALLKRTGLENNPAMKQAQQYVGAGSYFTQNIEKVLKEITAGNQDMSMLDVTSKLKGKSIFTDLPDLMQQMVLQSLKQKGKDSLTYKDWKEQHEGVKKVIDIGEKGTSIGSKVFADQFSKELAIRQKYLASLQEQLTLQIGINDKMATLGGMRAANQFGVQQMINPNRDFTVGEKYAPVQARLEAYGKIAGVEPGQVKNVKLLEDTQTKLQQMLTQNKLTMDRTGGANRTTEDDKIFKESQTAYEKNTEKSDAITKILGILHDDNVAVSAIKENYAKLQQRKSDIQGGIIGIGAMSTQERVQKIRELRARDQFLQTGKFTNPRQMQMAIAGSQYAATFQTAEQRDAEKSKIAKGIVDKAGLKGEDAKKAQKMAEDWLSAAGMSPAEKILIDILTKVNEKQIEAGTVIISTSRLQLQSSQTEMKAAEAAGRANMIGSVPNNVSNVGTVQNIPKTLPSRVGEFTAPSVPINTTTGDGTTTVIGGGGNAVGNVVGNVSNLDASLVQFSNAINKLASINIPTNIEIVGNITTTIDLNGAGALALALAQEVAPIIKDYINGKIPKAGTINPVTGETEPSTPFQSGPWATIKDI